MNRFGFPVRECQAATPQRRRAAHVAAVLAALLLGLVACGGGGEAGASPTPSTPVVVTPGTWVVMGSSSAAGVGASAGRSWATLLAASAAANAVTVQNVARGGALTHQALPSGSTPQTGRPAPDPAINTDRALAFGPRLVLLSFPTNDVVAGYDAEETATNLQTMQQALRVAGAATLVLGTQPRNALNAAQRATQTALDQRLATAFGACFVPLQAALADPSGQIATAYGMGDGIHLNDAGHARVLQQVQAALDSGRCVRLAAG